MSLDKPLAFQKLDIYVAARDLVRVVTAAKVRDAEFRDQAERAAKSTFLAICEGVPSPRFKTRRVYFERAHCSLCEAVGAIDGASVIGAVDARPVSEVMTLANRLEAMLIAMKR
jgi:four helix bundle protein